MRTRHALVGGLECKDEDEDDESDHCDDDHEAVLECLSGWGSP